MSTTTSTLTLSSAQRSTLTSVLDEIIPPSTDATFPGAGALGLAAYVEQAMAQTPDLQPVIAQGIATLDRLAQARGAASFAALCREDRLASLHETTATEPAFLSSLTFHTYVGYYQHERVLEALHLEPRPPYPEGFEMQPSDLASLLEPVRRRAKR
jgi:hypothetical protein